MTEVVAWSYLPNERPPRWDFRSGVQICDVEDYIQNCSGKPLRKDFIWDEKANGATGSTVFFKASRPFDVEWYKDPKRSWQLNEQRAAYAGYFDELGDKSQSQPLTLEGDIDLDDGYPWITRVFLPWFLLAIIGLSTVCFICRKQVREGVQNPNQVYTDLKAKLGLKKEDEKETRKEPLPENLV
jgi:hypothetical protein